MLKSNNNPPKYAMTAQQEYTINELHNVVYLHT